MKKYVLLGFLLQSAPSAWYPTGSCQYLNLSPMNLWLKITLEVLTWQTISQQPKEHVNLCVKRQSIRLVKEAFVQKRKN